MDKIQLGETLRSLDSEVEINDGKQFPEVTVPAAKLHAFAKQLKENADLSFDFLFCLTGVDYGTVPGVVYHLRSTKHNHSLVVKTRASEKEDPRLETVSDIWRTAEFHEREVFDLLGIRFINHPDLRRIFLEDPEGHPLRKDFVSDKNITG